MIFAFDLDGTLCEAWYGEESPDFYHSEDDTETRALKEDCYRHVKPLPQAIRFLESCPEGSRFVVLSRIYSGHEYEQKKAYLERCFINPKDGRPFFSPEDIYGSTTGTQKYMTLCMLSKDSKEDVIYFDDDISLVCWINSTRRHDDDGTGLQILALHSSSLGIRTPENCIKTLNTDTQSKYKL